MIVEPGPPSSARTGDVSALTLGDLGEEGLLARLLPRMASTGAQVSIGPGDDTAAITVGGEAPVLATTDSMVRGPDWLDVWSTGTDVGFKVVMQNLADLSAMGGSGTGLLVTLIAPPDLPVDWCEGVADGIALACRRQSPQVPVVGGDLSSSDGAVVVSVTALGTVPPGRRPIRRSGAAPGQVVAVSGELGRSAAGWALLRDAGTDPGAVAGAERGWSQAQRELVAYHRRPTPDLAQGPAAAAAGATALIDVSDGLLRDAGRIARASGLTIDLDGAAVRGLAALLIEAVGEERAMDAVLSGGEEHVLLATFPDAAVPAGWRPLGRTLPGSSDHGSPDAVVLIDGLAPEGSRGWDHFGG